MGIKLKRLLFRMIPVKYPLTEKQLMKRQPFTEKEVKAMINGTIREMVKDPAFFHHSSVGPEYSHFTPDGHVALCKQMDLLGAHLRDAMAHDDEQRSKQLVFQELKGNENV